MSKIETGHINILENSTVTLTLGTEDTTKPLYRLYDRGISRKFALTAAANMIIKIDQGATTILPVTNMIIPVGHTLNDSSISLEYSSNDADWFDALTPFAQSDDDLINKAFTSQTKRYWRFSVTSPGSKPEIPELFLTTMTEWTRNPARPSGAIDDIGNVINVQTANGEDRFLKLGEPKKRRDYHIDFMPESQRTVIEGVYATYNNGKPFYIVDHEGVLIYVKLVKELNLQEVGPGRYNADFSVLEVF